MSLRRKLRGYIISVDVGTTEVSSQLYSHTGEVVNVARRKITRLYPEEGRVEVDANHLFNQVKHCVNDVIEGCSVDVSSIRGMGICSQRNSMLTWNRSTGKPLHNFICWNDKRANGLCQRNNQSFTMKILNIGCGVLHFFTRQTRFLSGSILRFVGSMVSMRLLWAKKNIKQVADGLLSNTIIYGCIESWLLYNLTGGICADTEISLAASTGMFDPFYLDWNYTLCKLFGIPTGALPNVRTTCVTFVESGDQQSAMFGCGCFEKGDVKITMGTGSFIDLNCANKPHASMKGIFPVIGWKLSDKDDVVYMAEGFSYDTGIIIDWANSIGLFDDVSESSCIAESVSDSGGVYFVPAFSGLQTPYEDPSACTCFIGLKPTTTKSHMTRAVLESVVYRVVQILHVMHDECHYATGPYRICGGVSENDFICQLVADLTNVRVMRMNSHDMSAFGVGYMAGIQCGFWKDQNEVEKLINTGRIFEPCNKQKRDNLMINMKKWEHAVNRVLKWYKTDY